MEENDGREKKTDRSSGRKLKERDKSGWKCLRNSVLKRGNTATDEQARTMERKEALFRAEQLARKRSNILHNLQKLDSTDPESYLETFEAATTEGLFDHKDWLPTLRNLLTVKALSFFRALAVTEETLYLSFKTLFLERMGCIIKQAMKMLWSNPLGHNTSPRDLQPILRAITRIGVNLNTKADFTAECFKDVYLLITFRTQSTAYVIEIQRTPSRWQRNYRLCGSQSRHPSAAGCTS